MKKLIFPVCQLFILLFLVSCQKEIQDLTSNAAVTGTFRAKINGVQWTATASASATINSGLIQLTGIGNHKKLEITVLGSGTGTYILNDTSFNAATYVDSLTSLTAYSTDQAPPPLGGGQVTITKIDNVAKTISGTFSFKTLRSADSSRADFTEGVFENLKYTSNTPPPPPPPPGGNDTLTAKVAGVDFTGTSITALENTGTITVSGIASGNKTLTVQFPTTVTPGIYPIGGIGATTSGVYTIGISNVYMSTIGSMTVLEHNTTTKRVRANFNFTGVDALGGGTILITQGYLSAVHN